MGFKNKDEDEHKVRKLIDELHESSVVKREKEFARRASLASSDIRIQQLMQDSITLEDQQELADSNDSASPGLSDKKTLDLSRSKRRLSNKASNLLFRSGTIKKRVQ